MRTRTRGALLLTFAAAGHTDAFAFNPRSEIHLKLQGNVGGFRGVVGNSAAAASRYDARRRGLTTAMSSEERGQSTTEGARPKRARFGSPEPGPSWLVEERDACGVGFIANPQGRAEHKVVKHGLAALGCMEHRGACLADNV